MGRKLLVIDTSYAYEAIVARGLQHSVTCRDLGGFFDHVWTVHPVASLVSEGATRKFGKIETHALNAAHTFIDGKIGRFDALASAPFANFIAAQSGVLFDLASLIRREKISAIRANDPLYTGLLGLMLARSFGIPLVVRVNANYDAIYASTGKPMMPRLFRSVRVEKAVFRFVFPRADLVAAVNDDNLRFAVANGARPDRATIFRYGNLIDKGHLAPPETRDRSWAKLSELVKEPCPFILHVGRLTNVKFPDDVVRVLAEVRARGHELKAIMVGDGPMVAELTALARTLGVEEHLVFAGNRDQTWLAQVIPLASAVVSPLTGRALTEAAFGAAPIVAYDLDWQGELVRTGETGELVPSRSWKEMADSVERFLTQPEYARAMGDAVRLRALGMLDPAALDQHERDQYRALFARHQSER